jgi:hypothetical protein
MDDRAAPYVALAKVGDPAAANLAVALLMSAGIPARIHGEALGPYRLTIGGMAVTEVWVPEPDVDDAREVLDGSGLEHTPIVPTHVGALSDPAALPMRLLAGIMLLTLAWAVVRWLMRVF